MNDSSASLVDTVRAALDAGADAARVLELTLSALGADGGTVHFLGADGNLHLEAMRPQMPPTLLEKIRVIPVGKGMAGLAVQRAEPVASCNLQEDTTGDVRPGARETGLRGSTCVPVLDGTRAVGALGVGTGRERTFTDAENALLIEVGRLLAPLAASVRG